jgi:hypothetical protein
MARYLEVLVTFIFSTGNEVRQSEALKEQRLVAFLYRNVLPSVGAGDSNLLRDSIHANKKNTRSFIIDWEIR